jgi:hypothetical protein
MQNSSFGTNQFSIRHSKFRIQVDARLPYLYQIHRPKIKKKLLAASWSGLLQKDMHAFFV